MGGERIPALVRVTHWINTLSLGALVASGFAILLSHPRLYWGETGNLFTPSLIDLPLPFVLKGQNGPGRYLHFLAGWVCVLNGLVYAVSGVVNGYFRENLLPVGRARRKGPPAYTQAQRLAYLTVTFVLFPVAIWTGLAMSPAVTSVFPALVTVVGGHQSARTIHFFAAAAIVLFVVGHIAMVWRAGFVSRTRAMITGRRAAEPR